MVSGTWYTFTVEVTIEKTDGNYTGQTSVQYYAQRKRAPKVCLEMV